MTNRFECRDTPLYFFIREIIIHNLQKLVLNSSNRLTNSLTYFREEVNSFLTSCSPRDFSHSPMNASSSQQKNMT